MSVTSLSNRQEEGVVNEEIAGKMKLPAIL